MKPMEAISNFFSRVLAGITWKNFVTALQFLNVTDEQSGFLSPPKVLAWFISIGICFAMMQIGDDNMDLAVFAGAIGTLVGAFAVSYKLALDGDKEQESDRIRDNHREDEEYDEPKP